MTEQSIVERLTDPIQWGYICPVDGGFIADDTPLEAAALIERLTATEASQPPEGRVMVQREPTEAMLAKGLGQTLIRWDAKLTEVRDIWTAMLAAADTKEPSA